MIRKLCFELYKLDWKRSHMVTSDMESDLFKDYYEHVIKFKMERYTYEQYLIDFGYNGELYACYYEFLQNEYLDTEYIEKLLDNEFLINLYHKDIKSQMGKICLTDITGTIGEWLDIWFDEEVPSTVINLLSQADTLAAKELDK